MRRNPLDQFVADVLGEPSEFTEIVDGPQVHVLDNGASTQLLDRELIEGDGGDSAYVSDFEHREDLREEAQYGPDGQPLDDIDAAFHERALQRQEENERAPHACANPPSWDSGILGNTVTVNPAQSSSAESPTVPLVYWPGEERESLPVLVTLTAVSLPASANGVIRPFARIRWGNRSQFLVDVDIGRGCQLVIGGSGVYVEVGLYPGSDTPVQVSGSISYWGGQSQIPATHTDYFASIAHATTTAAQIRPNFSQTITIERATATVPFTINFLSLNGTTIMQRTVAASAFMTPVQLPNDCASITISNTDVGTDCAFRAIWGLDF